MSHENLKKIEKKLDLGNGTSIWLVHLDATREQDKNARVLPPEKFDRLTENIKKDGRLESLPLCIKKTNQAGNEEFLIVSGHHRIRAARAAGLTEIFIMTLEEELTRDQIIAKQLAHNALVGYDDPIMLKDLYAEIQDINAKLESGILEGEISIDLPAVSVDELTFDFDYEMLQILFLPKQKERFENVLKLIEADAEVYLADKADFERMKEQVIKISKKENIRNASALMARMVDIVEEYYQNKK